MYSRPIGLCVINRLSQIMTKEKSLTFHSVKGKTNKKSDKNLKQKRAKGYFKEKKLCEKHRLGERF